MLKIIFETENLALGYFVYYMIKAFVNRKTQEYITTNILNYISYFTVFSCFPYLLKAFVKISNNIHMITMNNFDSLVFILSLFFHFITKK